MTWMAAQNIKAMLDLRYQTPLDSEFLEYIKLVLKVNMPSYSSSSPR